MAFVEIVFSRRIGKIRWSDGPVSRVIKKKKILRTQPRTGPPRAEREVMCVDIRR